MRAWTSLSHCFSFLFFFSSFSYLIFSRHPLLALILFSQSSSPSSASPQPSLPSLPSKATTHEVWSSRLLRGRPQGGRESQEEERKTASQEDPSSQRRRRRHYRVPRVSAPGRHCRQCLARGAAAPATSWRALRSDASRRSPRSGG